VRLRTNTLNYKSRNKQEKQETIAVQFYWPTFLQITKNGKIEISNVNSHAWKSFFFFA
jgi:hypothetical protein